MSKARDPAAWDHKIRNQGETKLSSLALSGVDDDPSNEFHLRADHPPLVIPFEYGAPGPPTERTLVPDLWPRVFHGTAVIAVLKICVGCRKILFNLILLAYFEEDCIFLCRNLRIRSPGGARHPRVVKIVIAANQKTFPQHAPRHCFFISYRFILKSACLNLGTTGECRKGNSQERQLFNQINNGKVSHW